MKREDILTLICSGLQILGLVVAIVGTMPVITALAGFAAVVNYFLPRRNEANWTLKLKAVAGVCGVFLIVIAIVQSI